MKIKKGFVLRDVAGRSVVVATGAAAKKFRGMIMLNDTGKEIWIRLQKGMDQEEIIRTTVVMVRKNGHLTQRIIGGTVVGPEQNLHLKIRSMRQCVHGSVRDLARQSC